METSSPLSSQPEEDGAFQMETLLNTINAINLTEILEQLRTDGIVSRHRPNNNAESLSNSTTNTLRNQVKESV